MVSEGLFVSRLREFVQSRAGRLLLLFLGGALTGLTLIYNNLGLLEWLTLIPAACAGGFDLAGGRLSSGIPTGTALFS